MKMISKGTWRFDQIQVRASDWVILTCTDKRVVLSQSFNTQSFIIELNGDDCVKALLGSQSDGSSGLSVCDGSMLFNRLETLRSSGRLMLMRDALVQNIRVLIIQVQ